MEKHEQRLAEDKHSYGRCWGQQSASVQAMLNKISATAKKKEKKAKKKIRSRKLATPVVIVNVKAIKRN